MAANPKFDRTAAALPTMMQYVDVVRPGGPDMLQLARGPLPPLLPGEVLIRVAVAGVNRVDCQQRSGTYAPPPGAGRVLGVEVAGEVVALGDGAVSLRVGDRVCALVESGGYAEYCTAPARQCLPWPANYTALEAAALPETYFTVWANLFSTGCLKSGETLLVHGGTSGIGTTAIQLASAFGARVFATAGSAAKCAACVRLGASAAIDYKIDDFVAHIRDLTQGQGVDVVLDIVGGPYAARNLQCLSHRGRLVMIAFLGGTTAEKFDFRRLLLKHLTITGTTLRPRTVEQKGALADELRANVWPMLDAGRCAPIIDSTFPLASAAQAHARMESSEHIGKIMLKVA